MKVKPIRKPLAGEQVVGVYPTMAPEVEADWRWRLNFYTGRSLSDVALTLEQAERAGHLATRGQMISHGVVSGLEVGIERVESDGETTFYYHVAAGLGIAPSGEDVVVARPLRVPVRAVPVYVPASLLEGSGEEEGALPAWRLGPPLGELIEASVHLPRVGILVLQPVVVEMIGEFDPADPCEIDLQNDAYDDWQLVDGCRLVLYAWPTDLVTLPATHTRLVETWRNRAAYKVFEAEKRSGPDQVLPWEALGVPIGLVGFDASWEPLFVDRYAVVRAGGKPRRRTPLVSEAGNPFLWQARMQQFVGQITEAITANTAIEKLSRQFRYLPPAGLLPKEAVDPRGGKDLFFPGDYYAEAVPIPLEQLDAALEASAPLAHFDTFTRDRVQILVPVPQVWYEPNLLQEEQIDPLFQQTLDEFIQRRGKWLARRGQVRAIAAAYVQGIAGDPLEYPDPDALEEDEFVAADPTDPDDPQLAEEEDAYGTEVEGGETVVTAFEDLREHLRLHTPVSLTVVVVAALNELVEKGTITADAIVFPDLGDKIYYRGKSLFFRGKMTEAERDYVLRVLTEMGVSADAKGEVEWLYEESQSNNLSQLDELGLEKFIEFLEQKVKEADDKVDLGFVRSQTDIYRTRQLMLGNLKASRLATSPALASIAKGLTAAGTREDISTFLQSLEETKRASGSAPTPDNPGHNPGNPGNPGEGSSNPGSVSMSVMNVNAGADLFLAGELRGIGGSARAYKELAETPEATEAAAMPISAAIESQMAGGGQMYASAAAVQIVPQEYIIEQSSIVGKAYDFRTMTIAERLEKAEANETKDASVATLYEVVRMLLDLPICVDDIPFIGPLEPGEGEKTLSRSTITLWELRQNPQFLFDLEKDPVDADESHFFSGAVDVVERTVALLRRVEGRIQAYRSAIARCRQVLKVLKGQLGDVDRRLKVIGDELAEARHDVAVARALLAEETARVEAVNARRDRVVAEHVHFLAFRRPRAGDVLAETSARTLDPGLVESPVPECLARAAAIPAELRAMVDLLREVPLKWFAYAPQLLDRLDQPEILHQTIQGAKARAQGLYLAKQAVESPQASSGLLVKAINSVFAAQHQVVTQYRTQAAQLNLATLAGQSWQRSRDLARDALSLGDLIEAGHGRSDVAQQATRELDNIARVAGCLYSAFGEVLPSIRLNWAERLSQYDEPVNLRNLANLPRWGEIEYLDRREMQSLVDWLYQRVDARQSEAVAIMSDLVRVCILLASHAPVKQIIAGHVSEPTTAQEGGLVRLAVDPGKVRVGMAVTMYAGSQVVAQGVVEDLTAGQAAARVVKTLAGTVQLEQGARVQFSEQTALGAGSPAIGGVQVGPSETIW
jgi:hypothetical protein